ncbi:MAG TPA: hypothetical protein VIO16_02220 [Dehalococcoidia bacterium]
MATTIRVPISILAPAVSANGGNAFFSVAGLTAQDYGHWEFVKSVQGNLFGQVAVPHNLNATPNAKIILSFAANAATGNTVIQIGTARIPAGTSINPGSLTTETAQTITVPGTAYQRFDVTLPASATLAVTPQADDILLVEIMHNGAAGGETLAVNLLLLAAVLVVDLA